MTQVWKDKKYSDKTESQKREEVLGRVCDLVGSLYDDGLIYISNGSEGQSIQLNINDILQKHVDV